MSQQLNELQNATVGMTVGVIEVRFFRCLFSLSFQERDENFSLERCDRFLSSMLEFYTFHKNLYKRL